jgi:hypothetical protein
LDGHSIFAGGCFHAQLCGHSMNERWQFSLACLFSVIVLFAVSFEQLRMLAVSDTIAPAKAFLIYPALACLGAGIGGLLKPMYLGMLLGHVLASFAILLLIIPN